MEREGSKGTMRGTPSHQNYNSNNSSSQHYMPIANIIRIMRRILPAHAKISDDAKETIQECVSEYISVVTSEANERCHREQRKTVTADDLLWAMNKLGFEQYVRPLSVYLQRYRDSESNGGGGGGGGGSIGGTSNSSTVALTRGATATTLVPIQQYYFTGQVPQEGSVFGGCFVDGSPVVVNVNAGQLVQQSSSGGHGVVEGGTINYPYLNYGQYN